MMQHRVIRIRVLNFRPLRKLISIFCNLGSNPHPPSKSSLFAKLELANWATWATCTTLIIMGYTS